MNTLKFLPGNIMTGKIVKGKTTTRDVKGKKVTEFTIVVETKPYKDAQGNKVKRKMKDANGVEKDSACFFHLQVWGDKLADVVNQAENTERAMVVINYDVEPNNYEKDGRTIYTTRYTADWIDIYVFENGAWVKQSTTSEEAPY